VDVPHQLVCRDAVELADAPAPEQICARFRVRGGRCFLFNPFNRELFCHDMSGRLVSHVPGLFPVPTEGAKRINWHFDVNERGEAWAAGNMGQVCKLLPDQTRWSVPQAPIQDCALTPNRADELVVLSFREVWWVTKGLHILWLSKGKILRRVPWERTGLTHERGGFWRIALRSVGDTQTAYVVCRGKHGEGDKVLLLDEKGAFHHFADLPPWLCVTPTGTLQWIEARNRLLILGNQQRGSGDGVHWTILGAVLYELSAEGFVTHTARVVADGFHVLAMAADEKGGVYALGVTEGRRAVLRVPYGTDGT